METNTKKKVLNLIVSVFVLICVFSCGLAVGRILARGECTQGYDELYFLRGVEQVSTDGYVYTNHSLKLMKEV